MVGCWSTPSPTVPSGTGQSKHSAITLLCSIVLVAFPAVGTSVLTLVSNPTHTGGRGYPGGNALLNTQINVYSSANADLMNWRYEGVAFHMPEQPLCQPQGGKPSQPLRCYADRCKVLRNPATAKYVMWCKSKPFASVAVADNATGPFRLVKLFNPGGHEVGDCTATADPADPSNAYFVLSVHPSSYGFSKNDSRQVKIFQMTPDWTELTGEYRNVTAAWPLPNRYDGKLEAPAPFFDAETKRHYIWTSHCTYWYPNDAVLLGSAELFASELWSRLGNPTHNDTSWQSQSTYVLPVPTAARSRAGRPARAAIGSTTASNAVYTAADAPWIYIADRFMCNFDAGTQPGCPSYVDLNQTGRYVWLPIERGAEGKLVVRWHDEWRL